VKASADYQQYCSRDCALEAGAYGSEKSVEESTKAERICPECEESFYTYPSKDTVHCSMDCYSDSFSETVECSGCGREWERSGQDGKEYCCKECYYENERSRQGDDRDIVRTLFSEWEGGKLFRRVRANIGSDWDDVQIHCWICHYQFDNLDTILEHVANRTDGDAEWSEVLTAYAGVVAAAHDGPDHLDGQQVIEGVEASDTPYELSRELRCPRTVAKRILRDLEEVQSRTGVAEGILEDVREKLGIEHLAKPEDITGRDRGGRYDE